MCDASNWPVAEEAYSHRKRLWLAVLISNEADIPPFFTETAITEQCSWLAPQHIAAGQTT